MPVWLATKTIQRINQCLVADGGNSYRRNLGLILPTLVDAYRDDEDGVRSHLGASVIAHQCERSVWYSWRWAIVKTPSGKKGEPAEEAHARMIRLWNRGHLEEGRFVALLTTAGIQIYFKDENGKQYRFESIGGHFAGSTDGVLLGVPDLPDGIPCLLECKTHSATSFTELVARGVAWAKPEHYAQMQIYMNKLGLAYCLYFAVNKDTDQLHAEIVTAVVEDARHWQARARKIIFAREAPPRVRNASPGYRLCKYLCDQKDVCFDTVPAQKNCRTCGYSEPFDNGVWGCNLHQKTLTKDEQIAGCDNYETMKALR